MYLHPPTKAPIDKGGGHASHPVVAMNCAKFHVSTASKCRGGNVGKLYLLTDGATGGTIYFV